MPKAIKLAEKAAIATGKAGFSHGDVHNLRLPNNAGKARIPALFFV